MKCLYATKIRELAKKLEQSAEYLELSKQSDDEMEILAMEILAIGYLEKVYNRIYDIKDELCEKEF